MNVLSIDTTAQYCSLALKTATVAAFFHENRPREHAKIVLPEIQKLLTQANIKVNDLDFIVVGRGPGSFTGVRIATAIAQGLAMAGGAKILAVSTLQSLAWHAAQLGHKKIAVSLDARMSEVYFGEYFVADSGIPVLNSSEQVLPPARISLVEPDRTFKTGNGWLTNYEQPGFDCSVGSESKGYLPLPNAKDSLELALALLDSGSIQPAEPEQVQPTYLRDKVTWDNKPKVGSI